MLSTKPNAGRRPGEDGYILITAVWLLLLGASIVAIIMVHNLRYSEELSFEREMIKIGDAQESAVETIIADILFNGPRSQFALLPATSEYRIDGVSMQVSVSNENGKIDLNQADLELIRRALQGLGVSGVPREKFVMLVRQGRYTEHPFRSMIDVSSAFAQAGIGTTDGFCPEQYFTAFSGLSQPQSNQMDPRLSKALGEASSSDQQRFRPGNALRLEIVAEKGLPLVAVVRTSGLIDRSHSVLDWGVGAGCYQPDI
ncbi:MAG: hypothetical protein ABJP02_16615 [Parasphingorhabdus sp.]|uniref:hypothetical protein n=1 Tax=Parasphingorhabdus sp. TaxID=2709688 RepID=UPI0032977C53